MPDPAPDFDNRKAFLDMLAVSEGTKGKGNDGYNMIVGGQLFDSYADHPRVKVWIKRIGDYSTAAGRYQILARNFDFYKASLGLDDFSPDSQDKIAIELINGRLALIDIDAGRFDQAVAKCKNIWASLPGAGYGQKENPLLVLRTAYIDAGGKLTNGLDQETA